MKRLLFSLINFVVLQAILATSILIPAGQTHAAAGQFTASWYDYAVSDVTKVSVPQDQWTLVSQFAAGGNNASDLLMLQGERWMSFNQEAAGALGLAAEQVSSLLERASGNAPWVVARYVPERAQLRITAYRVIRTAEGMQQVWQADYTPHHGEHLKAHRYFLTASEQLNTLRAGYNPFQAFRGANTDPVFYNVGMGAAQVAFGYAIAKFRGMFGLWIETSGRLEQSQTKSGSILKKKITTTTVGYATPRFYAAVPLEMSTKRNVNVQAQFGAICVTGASACDSEAHVAISGFALEELSGGNIPNIEDEVYRNVESKSSWTGVFFMIVTAVITWGIGTMVTGAAGWTSAGAAASSGGGLATTAAGMGGLQIGAYAGLGYAGVNTLVQGGPLTNVQSGWLNDMGWKAGDIGAGTSSGATCSNKHCDGLYNATVTRQVTADTLSSFTATQQVMRGDCAASRTQGECDTAKQASGFMPRADKYSEPNTVKLMRDRRTLCVANGLIGAELRKCMAPKADASQALGQ